MTVAVLVPFASEESWRARARAHVTGAYLAAGYDTVEGTVTGPWRKAIAVADAARHTNADIFVVADADCLCAGVAAAAISAVEGGAPWAVPHGLVHRLDQAATEAVYAGDAPADTTGRVQRPYQGFAGGGIVVVPRATWERIPLDARFEGWGGEDSAWALALTVLAGPPFRGTADLYHFWHPPASRMTRRWGSPESRILENRYRRAARTGQRRVMADLIAEAVDALLEVAV